MYRDHLPTAIITVLILLAAFTVIRAAMTRQYERLVSRLPKDQLDPFETFLDAFAVAVSSMRKADQQFLAISGGLRGSFRRLATMDAWVQLVFLMFRDQHITVRDAGYVWAQAMLQIILTVLELPEAALCSLFKCMPHIVAYKSFMAHRAVIMRCEVAFAAAENAPECVRKVRTLL